MTARKIKVQPVELAKQAITLGECARELSVISRIGIFLGENIEEAVPHEWVRWLGIRAGKIGEPY